MKLYINDILLDIPKDFKIPRTKQVNEIGRLDNRQTNFSQRLKLQRTKTNTKALDHLALSGSTSRKPYVKNKVQLFNANGECEIFDGLAVVLSTTKTYDVTIYDGYISFTKAIENQVLTDVGLADLNHLKNLSNVIDTWDGVTPYRYNVADYNGNNIYDTNKLNIDYLIPSVNKKWLWDKIFEHYGFTYSGDIFTEDDFLNNWLTYPKTIGSTTQVTTPIHTWDWVNSQAYTLGGTTRYSQYLTHDPLLNNSYATSDTTGTNAPDGNFITVTNAGLYKFELSGYYTVQSQPQIDGEQVDNPIFLRHGDINDYLNAEVTPVLESYNYGDNFSVVVYQQLDAGETFSLEINASAFFNYYLVGDIEIDFSIVEGNQVDFEEAFIDLSVKYFINEVLWEFSLTPFKDKYTNNIHFLTHKEWFQTTNIYDWSNDKGKYIQTLSEKYKLGNYARRNFLRHKYNDSNADYNDGVLTIQNVNLNDSTDVIKSKIYTPEKNQTEILGEEYNVYKFWDKQVKDDSSVEYKPLEKRFYFMRSELVESSLNVGSDEFSASDTATEYYRENYDRLKFSTIVNQRYAPIYSILNTSKILTVEVYLNDTDIHELDFKKLVYIKEKGSYYVLNKIPNYIKEGVYKVELIEVDYNEENAEVNPEAGIIISAYVTNDDSGEDVIWYIHTNYQYQNYYPNTAEITYTRYDGDPNNGGQPTGTTYVEGLVVSENLHTLDDLPVPIGADEGWYSVQVIGDEMVESNIVFVFIDEEELEEYSVTFTDPQGYQGAPVAVWYNVQNVETINTINLHLQKYDINDNPIGQEEILPLSTTGFGVEQVYFSSVGKWGLKIKLNGSFIELRESLFDNNGTTEQFIIVI